MTAPLYNRDILRLAVTLMSFPLLGPPARRAELRSPLCGSVATVDIALDGAGCVSAIGLKVQACALGQAAAALLAEHAIGQNEPSLVSAADQLACWLGDGGEIPEWPGIETLAGARNFPARHGSIVLPFRAAAAAAGMTTLQQGAVA